MLTKTNRPHSTDYPRRVVQAPVYSPRWARFFYMAAVAELCLGVWIAFIGPHLVAKRAEELCIQEAERRVLQSRGPRPQVMNSGSACWRLRELEQNSAREGGATRSFVPLVLGLLYLGRRLTARPALQALRADRRPPVLYLRSFQSDMVDHSYARQSGSTKEAWLMSRLERIGPVLAIGRPGEKLAQLGAARLYVTEDDWPTIARRLMASARIVVIRVGKTPGIRWELAHALRELPPEKIVLWFPDMFKGSAYAVLRDVIREVLKVKLPETRPKSLMTFDANWKLRPTKVKTFIEQGNLTAAALESYQASHDIFERLVRADPGNAGWQRALAAYRRALGQSPTADSSLAVAPSLSDLLEQLEIDIAAPPPFRLHPATWIAVVVWLVLLWVVPGKRWSFSLVEIMSLPHFFGPLVEGATTMLLALGLAFILYIRNPTRRLRPSFVLCAVLALDSYWIIARDFELHVCTMC